MFNFEGLADLKNMVKSVVSDETHVFGHVCQKCVVSSKGSARCKCTKGYKLRADGTTCIDIDECLNQNGGCSDVCTNTEGSFKCSCNGRRVLGRNRKKCQRRNNGHEANHDPCEFDNGGCEQVT